MPNPTPKYSTIPRQDCGGLKSFCAGRFCKACWDIRVTSKPLFTCSACGKPSRRPRDLCRECQIAGRKARLFKLEQAKLPMQAFRQAKVLAKRRRERTHILAQNKAARKELHEWTKARAKRRAAH